MGADGAATLGAPLGLPTVVQPTTKLHILQDKMIMGVSGQVGLGQLYCASVEQLWKSNQLGRNVSLSEVKGKLRDSIFKDLEPAIRGANASIPFLGNNAAIQSIGTQSLIALPVGGPTGDPELIQLDWLGNPEAASTDLPFVSIGSGQQLADPFLAFLRHIFWPDKLPKVAEGVFTIVWTLAHAIEINPGGVSDPIQLAVLERKSGRELAARELSQEEIEEHRAMMLEAEEHLKHFKDDASGVSSSIPEAPAKEESGMSDPG